MVAKLSFPLVPEYNSPFPLVPPRSQVALGNAMVANLSLANKGIPKPSLGRRKKRE
jgi:hypothetical protein